MLAGKVIKRDIFVWEYVLTYSAIYVYVFEVILLKS